jgi:2-keto-4-pentenoate hydratase
MEDKAMAFDEQAAIGRFCEARNKGDYFPADWNDRLSFEEAYRVQLGVVARRVAAGERQVGWKVAQTSEATRRQFGFPEPVFGCLMEEGLRRSGHAYGRDELVRPGCEPEVCVRLGAPLPAAADAASARRAIDALHPAFEIIELRGDIAAQKALAIADNVAQKGVVLGDPAPLAEGLDLAATGCRVLINGGEAARGRGEAVLGDPVNSVVWLAGKLAEFGLSLRAGDLIMTGSITRMLPLSPGDRARAEFEGLGVVEVGIAA